MWSMSRFLVRTCAGWQCMSERLSTNHAGCDLYAVLAEYDGTGVPLAYMFVKKEGQSPPGEQTRLLENSLRTLKEKGLNPPFFGCDKDSSEIYAIESTWLGITIQLYQWHVGRAVDQRLNGSKKTSHPAYFPSRAQALIPDVEICFGSEPIRRPNGPHRRGLCGCASGNSCRTRGRSG